MGSDRLEDTSGGQHDHIYAATGTSTGAVPLAGVREVDNAVQVARAALPGWRQTSPAVRRHLMLDYARLLEREAESLAAISVLDNSVPMLISAGHPAAAADMFEHYAGYADKLGGDVIPTWPDPAFDYTRTEPYGVVGIIVPWNGPIFALAQTCAPALAAGNCVVIKPPELTPYAALRMGELFLEAGFPPGVVNVIPGGAEAGEALSRHPGVDKVHFTGSGRTAKAILESGRETLKPVGLELGGKSANIIFGDCDVATAATMAVLTALAQSGQYCVSGTRILAAREVYDEVAATAQATAGMLSAGDPMDPSTYLGPVISEGACERIRGVVQKSSDSGVGRLVAGGGRIGGEWAEGFYLEPAVFIDVDPTSDLAQQEVFGPVLAVIPFEDEADAVRIANATEYGLAAFVQTDDVRRAHRVAAALEVGNVWVNGFTGIPASVPFGGVKQSGYGRLGGAAGIREFTTTKNIWMAL